MSLFLKMVTPQQRSLCVLQSAKKGSVTAVQCAFHTQFHMEPPSRVSIYAWYKKFEQKGCIYKGKSPGRPAEIARLNSVRLLLVDCIKDKVFVPPLPRSLPELRQRITAAIASITRDTVHKVWDELDYHLDVGCVTRRAHIESL
jgi:hypothetical protein